jgi:MFS family permease
VTELLVDVRPLRESPAFRSWWLGSTLSTFGGQLSGFALLYYVWARTHEPALVGAIGLTQLVATVVGALLGGSLADRFDRRRLVLVTRAGQLVASLVLAVLVLLTLPLAGVFVVAAVETGLGAAGAPANRSFTARLLPPERLAAGLAVSRLADQVSLLAGPMVAGVLTVSVGIAACFVLDAVSFLAAMYGVARLPSMRPGRVAGPDLHGLAGGLRLVAGSPVLLGAFATDAAATVLAMPLALFPVVNAQVYDGSPVTLGLFAPAIGLGGIVAGALSGRVTASARQGRLMLVSASAWGLALTGFGLSRSLLLALACLAVAGAADTVSVVSRTSIVQRATPDALRGRVNALDFLVGAAGPQLGNARAGLVASATSGATSAALGGLTSLLAVLTVAALAPALRRWSRVSTSTDSSAGHSGAGSACPPSHGAPA